MYKQREIWLANFNSDTNPQNEERPCLIVSDDIGGSDPAHTVGTVCFFPGTSESQRSINVTPTEENGLDRNYYVNRGNMHAVYAYNLKNRIGILENVYWEEILRGIQPLLALY